MQKILIVEDNTEINNLLYEMLSNAKYQPISAFSGTESLLHLDNTEFDLVLLDLMLPGMSGEEVLKKIREKSDIPIIIISAKSEIDQKVDLLINGADDYIVKPFDVREVLARIQLQLKKKKMNTNKSKNITYKDLVIDNDRRIALIAGNNIGLTKLEYNILYILFQNPNKVFTKQELFELAWEEYYIGEDKTVNVHISNIRNKIKAFTQDNYIETVWGIGFRALL